ncbi:putative LuxR family transcriptional regulator [Oscillibacter valericigenes Sjm18-20]|nr:putative LuxR family transcriptional regulator [Oscillibacter valericigenes Sjm18-20]
MDSPSDTLLLSTKLKIPAPRKNYVVRRALFEELSKCADMGVIFVRGGAGTGKTTLLSSFIRETGLKNVCWVSLDPSNANVYSFWLYFTAAVSALWDDGESFLTLMRSNPDASHMENLLIMLINRLCGEEDYYMVLDDIHCIGDAALIRTFEFFIGAMPSNFHFFMLSREDPPVYLGPLAMSGRLLFIDGKQMQLTPEEGMAFLRNTLHMSESDEELDRLNAYADGWIGGLQLAAAAGVAGKHSNHLLRAGGGIAAEYMTREVFESLTRKERDFLTRTGFLSYFDAGICTVLFDDFTKSDFEEMLDGLVRKNLFIICVDEQNGIYRYHNILTDYLVQQFSKIPEESRKALYIKAAGAFEQRGDCEEALRVYCAAESYQDVLRVAKAMDGRMEEWRYLDEVPFDLLIQDADLAAQCFVYNMGNLKIDRCRALFEKFKENYGGSDVFRAIQFMEAYITSNNGILPKYHALTAEQIDRLHFGPVAKAMVLVENSAALMELMQYEEAENCIKTAIKACAGVNVFVDFFAYNELAQIYEEAGRLNDSLSCYTKSRELLNSPSMMSWYGANYYFGITGVYMRRMELEKAAETLKKARELLESQRRHIDITDMTLAFHEAEMKFLSGDDEAGTVYVEGILSEYSSFSVLTMGRLIHELDCAEKLSLNLSDEFLKELDASENYKFQPFMRLLRARLLFMRGEAKESLHETDEILKFSRLHNNKLHMVEAGLLKVCMLMRSGKTDSHREMTNLLREAIHYANDDRILMPFYLDRRTLLPQLQHLLSEAAGKNALSAPEALFLHEILTVCGGHAHIEKEPDILSTRELEVLNELSLGITNREIADKLCISQATVKTHVLSIFGKLGVSSRMMAVQEGRKKGLFK